MLAKHAGSIVPRNSVDCFRGKSLKNSQTASRSLWRSGSSDERVGARSAAQKERMLMNVSGDGPAVDLARYGDPVCSDP